MTGPVKEGADAGIGMQEGAITGEFDTDVASVAEDVILGLKAEGEPELLQVGCTCVCVRESTSLLVVVKHGFFAIVVLMAAGIPPGLTTVAASPNDSAAVLVPSLTTTPTNADSSLNMLANMDTAFGPCETPKETNLLISRPPSWKLLLPAPSLERTVFA